MVRSAIRALDRTARSTREGDIFPACLLLAAACFAMACQVFIETGVFARSYAMVGLISAALGLLALTLARVWKQ